MKRGEYRHVLAGALGTVGALFGDFNVDDVDAQTTNRWLFANPNGKWESALNWSAGAPTNSNAANFITNAVTKTVTIRVDTHTADDNFTRARLPAGDDGAFKNKGCAGGVDVKTDVFNKQ
jgi:hypothetical protein